LGGFKKKIVEITLEKLEELGSQTKDRFVKMLITKLKKDIKLNKRNDFYEQLDFQRVLNLIKREKNREILSRALVGLGDNKVFVLKISKGKDVYSYDVLGYRKLDWLSSLIQREFDLEPCHLYDFEIGKYKFGPECDEWQEIFDWLDNFRIDAAINAAGLKKGDKIKFRYDFGEDIMFKIKIEEIKDE